MERLFLTAWMIMIANGVVANTSIPDLSNSFWIHDLTEPSSVLICPAGDGQHFEAARTMGGSIVDATITLTLLDQFHNPIAQYPFEDLWLSVPGMSLCIGGSVADTSTDIHGRTTFSLPKFMGGIQSGDLDVVINLSDLVIFAQHLGHTCP